MNVRVSKLQRAILWKVAILEFNNRKHRRDGIAPLSVANFTEMPALDRLVARGVLVKNERSRVNLSATHRGTFMKEAVTEWKTLRQCQNVMKRAQAAALNATYQVRTVTSPLSDLSLGTDWTTARERAAAISVPGLRALSAELALQANLLESALTGVTPPTEEEVTVELVTQELEE